MKTRLGARFARIHTLDLAMLIGAAAAILMSALYGFAADCERTENSVFRLHILANSDSGEDQALKYGLRDYLLTELASVFEGCKDSGECAAAAERSADKITEMAQGFVSEKGYNYNIRCEVTKMYFTTRAYENVTLPAGSYDALRLTIGEGAGRNWWCVIFPSLCIPAVSEKAKPAELTEEERELLERLFPDGYDVEHARELLTEECRDFEVKFWLYELLRGVFG